MSLDIRERFEDFLYNLRQRITIKSVLFVALSVIIILALTAGFIWSVSVLIKFIAYNYQLLILGGLPLIGLIYSAKEKSRQRNEQMAAEAKAVEQQRIDAIQQGLERNYSLLRGILFNVLNETSDTTRLQRVTSLSSLDTPVHFEEKSGFIVYEYLVPKTRDMLPVEAIKEVLNNRIAQQLNAKEISGISQTVYIHSSGRIYPIIGIDALRDSGNFLQIDMVVAGKHYAEFTERVREIETTYCISANDEDF